MDEALIRYKNVYINQQELGVLEDVNLELNKGEFVYLIGKVGSGKTSLLKTIYGELDIQSGEAEVLGYNMTNIKRKHIPELRRRLGIVFQDFQLFPHLTVLENLVLSPIKTMNMSKEEAKQKALLLLEKLGLSKQINSYSSSLSGGQKQRVALARAMMINPKIIGYDEPTSALDPELRLEVEKLILQNKELGITQIVVTHDLQFAENIADSILKVEPK